MINYKNTTIERLSAHRLGNIAMSDDIMLSDLPLPLPDDELKSVLLKYFLGHFKIPEFFAFELQANPVFDLVAKIFQNPEELHQHSRDIATYLFRVSTNPKIKNGDLFVSYFDNIEIDNEVYDAIGIYKAETKGSFLDLKKSGNAFKLNHRKGIPVSKIDKACLILNGDADTGYQMLTIDKTNDQDALYWRNDFLKVSKIQDNFYQTQQYLQMTRSFVEDKLPDEFEVDRSQQLEIMDRSMNFFKKNGQFNAGEFETEVLEQEPIKEAFRNYRQDFGDMYEAQIDNQFDISAPAVSTQNKFFKSVLKLDKNFHVYIHGDRSKIERGMENDGRKFYKIYYNEEN